MHLESNAIYQIESVLNKNFKKINEVMYSIQNKNPFVFIRLYLLMLELSL